MPQVKINYVVSFSSEDPEHPASGLLEREVGRRRWLARAGDSPASVVLQLEKAVKIGSVSIGGHQTALVEVLVGRSETPNDPFEVLVPSSVFQSPAEARRAGGGAGGAAERVRSFAGAALAATARAQRWDRLRVVCSQPYNKHCKFGLSFVHVFSEEPPPAAPPAPARAPRAPSSDEEEFRPGELFARHRAAAAAGDTGAQIRQATAHAMNDIPDSSVKLTKTPIVKPRERRRGEPAARASETERAADRGRDALLYTADDGRPPDSAQKHNGKQEHKNKTQRHDDKQEHKTRRHDDKQEHKNKTQRHDEKQEHTNKQSHETHRGDGPSGLDTAGPSTRDDRDSGTKKRDTPGADRKRDERRREQPRREQAGTPDDSADRRTGEARKRRRSDDGRDKPSPAPHALLAGVVLVLSGYENPRRARLRTTALALGAAARADWGPACTHLM